MCFTIKNNVKAFSNYYFAQNFGKFKQPLRKELYFAVKITTVRVVK